MEFLQQSDVEPSNWSALPIVIPPETPRPLEHLFNFNSKHILPA